MNDQNDQNDYQEYDREMIHIFNSVRRYIEEKDFLKEDFRLTIKMYRACLGHHYAYVVTNAKSDPRVYEVDHTDNPETTKVTSYLRDGYSILK